MLRLIFSFSDADLAYQNYSTEFGVAKRLASFTGLDLIGAKAQTPLSNHQEVYVWPALKNTGWRKVRTGLGISCPSISLMDCYFWKELQEKAELRANYNLNDDQVLPFGFVDLIRLRRRGLVRDINMDLKGLEIALREYDTPRIQEMEELADGFTPLVDIEGFQERYDKTDSDPT